MRCLRTGTIAVALLIGLGLPVLAPAAAGAQEVPSAVVPVPAPLLAGHATEQVHVADPPKPVVSGNQLVAHSTINVTYTGFTPGAQAAFQYAVDLLETVVFSSVPITVNANFSHLGANVLGSAGPAVLLDGGGFPSLGLQAGTFYPVSLISAKLGHDQCPTATAGCGGTAFDISASFSSDFPFYLGTDGNTPLSQYDFVSVVLHELTHGLGFLSGAYTVGASTAQRVSGAPFIYERFLERGNGTSFASLASPSSALRQAIIGNDLFFDGPAADLANGGVRPKIYAPATFDSGSSIGHLDEATYPAGNVNTLMTPTFNDGQSVHDPGPIGRGILKDIGWAVAPYPPTHRVAADFDGDGDSDVSVWRPTTGQWFVNGASTVSFGATGDIPVPGDYDGDGDTDVAVWRPLTGQWFINGMTTIGWGASGDVPVPGDYDGDGDTDVAVWRPTTGQWFIVGQPVSFFGANGDVPVPADYDGDGDTDIAVWRPNTGQWFITGGTNPFFGAVGDVPLPADYDGDGDADLSVWRPTTGQWYVANQSNPFFGANGDIPIPADYNGDGAAERAVFRPSSGTWFIQGANPFALGFGANGDIPLPKRPTLTGGS